MPVWRFDLYSVFKHRHHLAITADDVFGVASHRRVALQRMFKNLRDAERSRCIVTDRRQAIEQRADDSGVPKGVRPDCSLRISDLHGGITMRLMTQENEQLLDGFDFSSGLNN